MAIRYRQQRHHWEVYWRNPYTSRIQTAVFAEKGEAIRHDAWIKYKLQYEKEWFLPDEKDIKKAPDDTLEATYYLYLKEKQFSLKMLRWNMPAMKLPLQLIGRKRVSAITKADLAGVLAKHLAGDIKTVTARDRMKVLFTVLRWAKKRGLLDRLPDFPELPTAHYKPIDIPTQGEVQAMLENAPLHLQRIIIIAVNTGIRVGPSELFKLTWDDVDLDRAVIRVRAAAKNPKEPIREVPIRSGLLGLFRLWREEDAMRAGALPVAGYVCNYCGRPVRCIKTAWTTCLRAAGIKRAITPYSLRHLFATEAIAAGTDVGTVAKLMGHASPDMVLEHYQHVLTRQKKAAVESLPMLDLYGQACMGKKNRLPIQ